MQHTTTHSTKKGSDMSSKTMFFFEKPDLLTRLRATPWTNCVPEGQNFSPIGLAGYCLTRPADRLCPLRLRVSVLKISGGDEFLTEGFCYKDVFLGMEQGKPCWDVNKIFGEPLRETADTDHSEQYMLVVEG